MDRKKEKVLTAKELAAILQISESTVKKLAKEGELPCTFFNRSPRFDIEKTLKYFESLEKARCENLITKTIKEIKKQTPEQTEDMRLLFNCRFPAAVKALLKIDDEYNRPKRRKGFNLIIRESKKHGRRIYARLSHNGKTLPTAFNTYTDNEQEAENYVLKNKEKLIAGYLTRKEGKIYKILETFYQNKKGVLAEKSVREYENMIKNKFIPFLKKEKINEFEQINKHILHKFQDSLKKGFQKEGKKYKPLRPQTVNNNFKAIRRIFKQLEREMLIENNPCEKVKDLPLTAADHIPRGCYELEKLKGVFFRKWRDETAYLLNAIIYTTGLRNSEIRRIKLEDIQLIEGFRFINVRESKTVNGIRLVPLHDKIYKQIKDYAQKNGKEEQEIFNLDKYHYERAAKELRSKVKMSEEYAKKENITFYSGRHFWKTLMNSEGLGEDIEEVWMGHKVTRNVAKLYNHKDKQGKQRMIKKAKEVFDILDRCLF